MAQSYTASVEVYRIRDCVRDYVELGIGMSITLMFGLWMLGGSDERKVLSNVIIIILCIKGHDIVGMKVVQQKCVAMFLWCGEEISLPHSLKLIYQFCSCYLVCVGLQIFHFFAFKTTFINQKTNAVLRLNFDFIQTNACNSY